MKSIVIKELDQIEKGAREFLKELEESSKELKKTRVVAFYGSMGAGKTTFIKALCSVMGVEDDVSSPTFNIVNEYLGSNRESIYHFDFYRIDKISEAIEIGVEEYLYSGNLCFIEWPKKIEQILPEDTLKVQISVLDNYTRVISQID